MTLWNIIRDFFVQYVFGGRLSNGEQVLDNLLGNVLVYGSDGYFNQSMDFTYTMYFKLNGFSNNVGNDFNDLTYISMGDWLSTTATIITLVGLFIAITLLIISLFKWIVRLVSLRG